MFARGRSKNAPTKTNDLLRSKQIINPDRFIESVGVRSILFAKLEFVYFLATMIG